MRHRRVYRGERVFGLGFTLTEMMVTVAVIGAVLAMAVPRFNAWMENQRARAAARSLADVLARARGEAIRTGNRLVVYFGNPATTDPSGNPIEMDGDWVPVLLIDDGAPATANCAIEGGEPLEAIEPVEGIAWGVTFATGPVPTDNGAAPFDPGGMWDGATFADPNDAKKNWVIFRPDGVPVTSVGAVGSCGLVGNTGGGGGAFYITNGERDFAVVLSPLGGARVHVWSTAQGGWTS